MNVKNNFMEKVSDLVYSVVFMVLLSVSFLFDWPINDCYIVFATGMFIVGTIDCWVRSYTYFAGPKAYNPNSSKLVQVLQIVSFCILALFMYVPFYFFIGCAINNQYGGVHYFVQLLSSDIDRLKGWIMLLVCAHLLNIPKVFEYKYKKSDPAYVCTGGYFLGLFKCMGVFFLVFSSYAEWVKLWLFLPLSLVFYPIFKVLTPFLLKADKSLSKSKKMGNI